MSSHHIARPSRCIQCGTDYIRAHVGLGSNDLCRFCDHYHHFQTRECSQFRFRAWHKKRKKMFAYAWICPGNRINCSDQKDGWNNEIFDSEDVIVMQSTTIKNYEDVEIFEGDKIQYTSDAIFSIYWDGICSSFRYYIRHKDFGSKTYSLSLDSVCENKVVGHIYELKSEEKK